MHTDYNCYGNHISKKLDNINAGDTVEFSYHKYVKINGRSKNTTITLIGKWDGEKVWFTDKDETVVRTTEWLKLVH